MLLRDFIPSRVLGLTWRQHIGGPWAVRPLGFALIAPVLFITTLANIRDITADSIGRWTLISAVTILIVAAVWWLASVTVLRDRRREPTSITAVAVTGALSFAARSAVVSLWAQAWGLEDLTTGELLSRVISVGIQGAVGVPLLALVLSIVSRYRQERARLIDETVALQARNLAELEAVDALRDALADPVRKRLAELADGLGDDSDDSQVKRASEEVREHAHQLWGDARLRNGPPRLSWRRIITTSLRRRPLPLSAILVLWLPPVLATLTTRVGLTYALVTSSLVAAALLTVFSLGNVIARRYPALAPSLFFIGTIGGGIGSAMLIRVLDSVEGSRGLNLIVASTTWIVICTLVMSLTLTAIYEGSEVLDELQAQVDEGAIDLLASETLRAELSGELATVLHGVVQGRLVAAHARGEPAPALARAALRDGLGSLSLPRETESVDLAEHLHQVSEPWDALLTIRISAPNTSISARTARDTADVVDECISNAFRHGGATQVDIAADLLDGTRLHLSIRDDGAGGTGEPGLGSQVMTAITRGNWSRESLADGGCRVVATLPVEHLSGESATDAVGP